MHKFGKMDRHLHATVPVPCNSKYSMLMSLMMNILFTQKIQCCTIYIKIYRVSCRKTNSEPFSLLVWRKRAESTRTPLSCFSIARIGGLQKKSKQNVQIKKKSNKQIKARLLDNQPCEKEHPKMSQLNIPQGNLLKNLTINIYILKWCLVRSALRKLVCNERASSIKRLVRESPSTAKNVTFWQTPNPGSYKLLIHTRSSLQQYTFLPF